MWKNQQLDVSVDKKEYVDHGTLTSIFHRYSNDDLRVRKEVKVLSGTLTTMDVENYVYDGDQVSLTLDGKLDGSAVGYVQGKIMGQNDFSDDRC